MGLKPEIYEPSTPYGYVTNRYSFCPSIALSSDKYYVVNTPYGYKIPVTNFGEIIDHNGKTIGHSTVYNTQNETVFTYNPDHFNGATSLGVDAKEFNINDSPITSLLYFIANNFIVVFYCK
jgi:hypothetical protein